MKKTLLYIALPCLLAACDVLDTVPTDRLYSEVYWKTDQDAELAANAIYRFLEDPGTLLGRDAMSDIARATFETSDETKVEASIADSQTNLFQNTWNDLYKGIRRCNDYMVNVDKIESSNQTQLDTYTAEVRTLRAYFYSRLVAYFGDVPLVVTPIDIAESKELTRTPVAEIYEYIYKELSEAANYLPEKAKETGRITKGAALGILARTMLFAAGNVTGSDDRSTLYFQRAQEAADAVIASGTYSLFPSYRGLLLYENENKQEVILDKQFLKDVYPSAVMNNFGAVSLGNNGSQMSPTAVLVDEYETIHGKSIEEDATYDPKNPYENRDPRLSYTLYVPGSELPDGSIYDSRPGWSSSLDVVGASYQVSKTGYLPRKYINVEDIGRSNRPNCAIYLVIMRYAEILLIAAESRIEQNKELDKALLYLNQIRQREDVNMPILSLTSQEDLRKALRHERLVELALEGHRFFDIRRWRTAESVCNTSQIVGLQYVDKESGELITVVNDYSKKFGQRDYLWPIPYNERQLNGNLTQNLGWD